MNWFKKLVPNLNLLLVAVLIAGLFTFLVPPQPVQAQSWLSGYTYRQGFAINGTTAGVQTNYTMQLTVLRYGPGQTYQGLIDSLPFTGFTGVASEGSIADASAQYSAGVWTIAYDATYIIEDGNDPNTLLLYHGGGDGGTPYGGSYGNVIGLLIGNKATNVFTRYNGAIVVPGPAGAWDSAEHLRLGNVVFKDGTFYLYYQGGSGGPGSAGLATSTDGRIFTKYSGNPVATDPNSVQMPHVFIEGNNWYMYYLAVEGGLRTFKVKTSTDGINWVGGTVIKVGSWSSSMPWAEGIHVYKIGDTYVMIYDTFGEGSVYNPQIGLAYSSTPTGTFTDYAGNPVLAKSGIPGRFDEHAVTMGSLYWDGEKWRVYYLGVDWDYPLWLPFPSPWKAGMVYGKTLQSSGSNAYLGGGSLSWPKDIRFTTNDGSTLLDYRVVSNTTSSATVYVEFDSIPISPGTVNFYMYYGKLSDSGASNSELTLEGMVFSDNFTRTNSETVGNGWIEVGTGDGAIESNQLKMKSTSGVLYANHLEHNLTLSQNMTITLNAKAPNIPLSTSWDFIIIDENPTSAGLWGINFGNTTAHGQTFGLLYSGAAWDYTSGGSYTPGSWYALKMEYNNSSRTVTFSMGGAVKASDKAGWSDSDWAPYANNISFGQEGSSGVDWYIDDVSATGEGVSPPPTWEGWASQEGGSPEIITYAATGIGTNTTTLQGRINTLGNLGPITQRGFDWGTTTGYGSEWTETGTWGIGDFPHYTTGLIGGTLYHYRAKAYSGGIWSYGVDVTFSTQPVSAPVITTGTAADRTTSSATLQGTLDSLGDYTPVYVYFQYGTTTSYGTSTAEQTKTAAGGFSQPISGLAVGTLYHFRAVVRYGASLLIYGSDATFSTSGGVPAVTTGIAVDLTTSGATLQGTLVDLGGYSPVYVFFQYGRTAAYELGSTIEQTKTAIGGFSHPLTGLTSNSLYYFRAGLRYGTTYIYGSQATFTTLAGVVTPGAPVSFSASATATQINLSWSRGTGTNRTLVRYATDTYPTTITSGTQLYFDIGIFYAFTIAESGVTYYFSAWSEAAGVYSTSYARASGRLGTPGLISYPPGGFNIDSVKIFRNYLETGDILIVLSYKELYAEDPAVDIKECMMIRVLDGTILKAGGVPTHWGFRPSSIWIAPGNSLVWGAEYEVVLSGREGFWAFDPPPSTSFVLTAGSWMTNLDYLQTWVLDTADRIEQYYYTLDPSVDLVTYVAEGRALTTMGGDWFSSAIPGLRGKFPGLFSTGVMEIPGYERGEIEYQGAENMTAAWGEDIAQQFQDLGESLGLSGESAGGVIWLVFVFIIAGIAGLATGPGVGIVICLPLVATGVYLRVLEMTTVTAIAILLFVLAMFVWIIKGRVSA